MMAERLGCETVRTCNVFPRPISSARKKLLEFLAQLPMTEILSDKAAKAE